MQGDLSVRRALLLDTDVLIDFLRGREEAVRFIDARRSSSLCVSVLTIAEILVGVRGAREESAVDGMLAYMSALDVDLPTASQGGAFRRRYHGSHGTGLVEAILAATALRHGCTLVTLNRKHYPMVSEILVPYVKR